MLTQGASDLWTHPQSLSVPRPRQCFAMETVGKILFHLCLRTSRPYGQGKYLISPQGYVWRRTKFPLVYAYFSSLLYDWGSKALPPQHLDWPWLRFVWGGGDGVDTSSDPEHSCSGFRQWCALPEVSAPLSCPCLLTSAPSDYRKAPALGPRGGTAAGCVTADCPKGPPDVEARLIQASLQLTSSARSAERMCQTAHPTGK